MSKIRLQLIVGNRLLRDQIAAMMKSHKDIVVMAGPGSGENGNLHLHELQPDVSLLDLGSGSQTSTRAVEIVEKESLSAKVIAIDISPDQGEVFQFVKAGVSGFLLRDATADEFLATIRSVAEGECVLPPSLNGALFSEIRGLSAGGGQPPPGKVNQMTNRENEVIALIKIGLSNKEIAERLQIATYTIKSHVHNIMGKLTLHTRLQVANHAASQDVHAREPSARFAMVRN